MYPLDLMQQVIVFAERLSDFPFGAGEKKRTSRCLGKAYTNVHSIVGKIRLKEQLDLMAHLDLMISMDSANAHMAANTGVRVLTLWGMTHPFCGFSFQSAFGLRLTLNRSQYPLIPTSIYKIVFLTVIKMLRSLDLKL